MPEDWDILYLGCYQNVYADDKGNVLSSFLPARVAQKEGYTYNLCPAWQMEKVEGTSWIKLNERCIPGTWAYALSKKSA